MHSSLLLTAVLVAAASTFAQAAATTQPAGPAAAPIRVLLVTGGHPFDHDAFMALFKSWPDVVTTEMSHPEGGNVFERFGIEPFQETCPFDVIVLYDMWQPISDKAKENFVTLLRRGKGLVALHHSIANYVDWPEYERIIGGKYHLKDTPGHKASTYKHGIDVAVSIAAADHPITAGMKPFTIHDEVYKGCTTARDATPLVTTNHPASDTCIGWAKRYANARVVYLQSGHGPEAYANEHYRHLVGQAIRWAADLLPVPKPDRQGFVSLFNGENLDGWVIMGNPAGFVVKNGVIHSEGESGADWMRTVRQYRDFVLKLDWRVSKDGNSGVFLRSTEDGQPWVTGVEVQISSIPRDESHCTGSLYGYVAVNPRPDESPDRWHTFEIRVVGRHYTVVADAKKVCGGDARDVASLADKPLLGYLGVQDSHAAKPATIEYRNIRVRDLTNVPEGRMRTR
jgi:type 1 glutamine amidotransferase